MKFGGGCLRDGESFKTVAKLLRDEPFGQMIIVVSAIYGVTNSLEQAVRMALESESSIPRFIDEIRVLHENVIKTAIEAPRTQEHVTKMVESKIRALERLLYGISYTGEITDTVRVIVLSQGERLSAMILAAVLSEHGKNARDFEADKIGLVTDDVCMNATANLALVKTNLESKLSHLIRRGVIPVITGFFGCTEDGKTTSFGRNGSDYSAAVIAYALEAKEVHIWKDVDGFMTADPGLVKSSRRIKHLSYMEAAELSYFGARILHPRTVEPLIGTNTRIYIKHIHSPKNSVTLIEESGREDKDVIKSVTFNDRVAVLRVLGAGVGHKPGIIGEIGKSLSDAEINIFSVLTSQTCINLLLDSHDAARGIDALRHLVGGVIERLELRNDVALIAVVGEGLIVREGLAARVFSAVAEQSINVEMFAAGASDVAYYFIVAQKDMQSAIFAVHKSFFEE